MWRGAGGPGEGVGAARPMVAPCWRQAGPVSGDSEGGRRGDPCCSFDRMRTLRCFEGGWEQSNLCLMGRHAAM